MKQKKIKKHSIKDILIGMTIATLFFVLIMPVVAASAVWKKIDVAYDNYKIYVNGEQYTATDKNGKIEPFSYNGWIYAPFEHIAKALNKDVRWDGKTNSLYIDDKKEGGIAPAPTSTIATTTFDGRLDKSDTINTYDFNLPYASRVTLDFEHAYWDSNTEYWKIQFLNKAGVLYEFTVKGNMIKTSTNYAMYLPAGDYYVRVSTKYNDSNFWWNTDYKITVNYEKNTGKFETEDNNIIETTNKIQLNNAIIGNLSSSGDMDYFKFMVNQKTEIYINFEHAYWDSNTEYWKVQLISKNGGILKEFSVKGNVMETACDKITLDTGDYYVKVSTKYNDSNFYWRTDYTLTVVG